MIELHVEPGLEAAAALTQVKLCATRFPGEHELVVVVHEASPAPAERASGREVHRLTLGEPWAYDASDACLAALNEFGRAVVV